MIEDITPPPHILLILPEGALIVLNPSPFSCLGVWCQRAGVGGQSLFTTLELWVVQRRR